LDGSSFTITEENWPFMKCMQWILFAYCLVEFIDWDVFPDNRRNLAVDERLPIDFKLDAILLTIYEGSSLTIREEN
jgi:hypothetical protein